MKETKEENRIKTKIGVVSVMPEKVGDMDENTRDVISGKIEKDVMVCVQDVARKKFPSSTQIQLEKRDGFFLAYICMF